jgi:molybdopterin molybdotransferase
MISVREALDVVIDAVAPLAAERVGLLETTGRVIAEDVRSLRDVPGYANSAMDGYAVRAADVAQAPARLRVVGAAPAGAPLPLPHVGAGEAVKIMTGGAVPPGADTVVKVEDTDAGSETVEIREAPKPGANIRQPAEDIAAGTTVLQRGRRISPADVGLLASIGRSFVQVHRRPTVAIVSTGDELVEADEEVTPGRVVNSNAYALAAAVAEAGAIPVLLPIARDDPASIRAVLFAASRHDVILSTGGVSVGEFDYVNPVMDELGVRRLFWKVAQKPGKPLTFGTLASSVHFGLPGNPVSSLVCFYLYARPALRRMAGHDAIHLASATARLAESLRKPEGLTEFVRVRLETDANGLVARSTGTQSSGVLSSMSQGRGMLVGPAAERELRAGERYPVILLDAEASAVEPAF